MSVQRILCETFIKIITIKYQELEIQCTFNIVYFLEKTLFHDAPYNPTVKQALCLPNCRSNYPVRTLPWYMGGILYDPTKSVKASITRFKGNGQRKPASSSPDTTDQTTSQLT